MSKNKSKTQTCEGCQHLGIAKLDSEHWQVCKFPSITDMFDGGRFIEQDEFPDWCPKPVPKKTKDLNVITHRSLEDSFVRVIHEPTGICEESNLYKSTHRNMDDAMRKIATRLEIIGDKDGSEREDEVLEADGIIDQPHGAE